MKGATGPTGATGAPGPASLAALQGSPCTFDGNASSISVSQDPTTGVVTLTCNPAYLVSVSVTGGSLTNIQIANSATSGQDCSDATTCSSVGPPGSLFRVTLSSGVSGAGGGSSFSYSCNGADPEPAAPVQPGYFVAYCPGNGDGTLAGNYEVPVSFSQG